MVQAKVTADAVRRTLRTALAVTVAVATVVPLLIEFGVVRVDPAGTPWLAAIVAVSAGVTRLMADPRVDQLIGRVLGAGATRSGILPVVDKHQAGKHRDPPAT
jgi:hypothetical protein